MDTTAERDGATDGGLSRRALITRAAAVGAAAWTAPMVLDSLTSPAGALTPGPCTNFAVKIGPGPSVTCESFCFENGGGYSFPANDAYWAGTCSRPTGCSPGANTTIARPANVPAKMPVSLSRVTLGGVEYVRVQLASGCTFSSATGWQIGGRYEPGSPGSNWTQASAACGGGPSGTTVGCYQEGGSLAWIISHADGLVDSTPEDDINYVYLKFCCSV